jgi:ABC-type nitrate/sulfonate/bicarbonate transport system substrate-binding protein
VEMIVIRGALGVTALLGGSVDYTTASGSIVAAAIRGIGVKLLLLIESKPGFDLVSDSAVRSFDRLKGRPVGISSRGGSVDLLTR